MSSHMPGAFSNHRRAPGQRSLVNLEELGAGTARTRDVARWGLVCGKLTILAPGAPGRTAPAYMIPLPERCFTRQLRRLARIEDADTPHKLVAAVCRHEPKYRELAKREGRSFDDVRWFTGELCNVARWWKNAKARGAPVQS